MPDVVVLFCAFDKNPKPMRSHTEIGEFIWRIADRLRGDYEKNDNKEVMLPRTLLRRIVMVLFIFLPVPSWARGGSCGRSLLCDISAIVVIGIIVVALISSWISKRGNRSGTTIDPKYRPKNQDIADRL